MDRPPEKSSDQVRKFQIIGKRKKMSSVVPKGCFAVSVGEGQERFVVPTRALSHPAFRELLREAEEEFGFGQKGILRIPCEVFVFEHVMRVVEGRKETKVLGIRGRRLRFGFLGDNDWDTGTWSGSDCVSSPACR